MEERFGKKTWLGAKSNTLVLLIAILVIVFCIFTFIFLAYRMTDADKLAATKSYYNGIFDWFTLPSNLTKLLERPWTILTYMFLHGDVFHLVGNMIWLWVFGYILQDLTGSRTIIPLFIYGGLSGALIFLLALNLVPGLNYGEQGATLVGASAGIMAIAIATTILSPGYRFFPMINGGIPLWVVTVVYVIIDLAKIAGDDNAGGHVSHLGGAIFGFVFMKQMQRGRDWSAGMSRFFDWVNDLFNPGAKVVQMKKLKEEYHYNTTGTQPYKKVPNLTQKRIDAILDKIGEKGYQQLTEEEKQILKRAAEDENL